jgi:aspartyl-tRNA(Asn)/glutamyl-tRNA(Gln) amidotransferase subunit C
MSIERGLTVEKAGKAIQIAPRMTATRTAMPTVSFESDSHAQAANPPATSAATPISVRDIGRNLTRSGANGVHPYTRPMPIDIDIAHVARLARLDLDEQALATYRAQLGVILDHAARVQSVDVEGVEPTAHPLGFTNAFRPDEVRPSLDRDEVLAAAPEARDGYFVAPPALEQD